MKNYLVIILFFSCISIVSAQNNEVRSSSSPSIANMQFTPSSGIFQFDIVGSSFTDGEVIKIRANGIIILDAPLSTFPNQHVEIDLYSENSNLFCFNSNDYIECNLSDGQINLVDGCWIDIIGVKQCD